MQIANFPSVVVLGDCVATAVNVLLPDITGDPDCLADNINIQKKLDNDLYSWFLKNNKEKVHYNNLIRSSHNFKAQQEKALAWPSHIPDCYNLAVTGETFQGMHKKIKKHMESNTKPELVLITDFSNSHRCVVLNRNSQKYVVKRDLIFLEEKQYTWPDDVYNTFVEKVKQQEKYGEIYQKKKHKKSFNMLIRFLEQNSIKYKFLLFRKENEYISGNYHDLTNFQEKYTDNKQKEMCSKKLQVQKEISLYIKELLLIQ